MPRRNDLQKILLIGSGPIVIGQACEFDYSGTQGAKALLEEGYEVVLVNSNPATIMTDPDLAGRTYVEPLEPEFLRSILRHEKPSAVLPTLGGQTALNLALALDDQGVFEEMGIELLGAKPSAIRMAEDRKLFKEAMARIGLSCPRAAHAHSVEEARRIAEEGTEETQGPTGYPVIVRPSFTLGGSGGGVAYTPAELTQKVSWALQQSPTASTLIEESMLGWKEYELEVIRDSADNFIVVCTIENIDPMGVHTGDSITVAPAMTLTDREFQTLRDAARAVMSEIGVSTGGSNVQFAVNPKDGRIVVIEMNPRVSRSSALASKATGYPIAKIAAKLAVGYRLDELINDITQTSAAFEPTIDYVVAKWPRFAFEKFPGADRTLGTQMKSVGEVMSIGRTCREAIEKAARSLETDRDGLGSLIDQVDYFSLGEDPNRARDMDMEAPREPSLPSEPPPSDNARAHQEKLATAVTALCQRGSPDRLFYVADAIRLGTSFEEIHELTGIDPWFIGLLADVVRDENALKEAGPAVLSDPHRLRAAKRWGMSDRRIGNLINVPAAEVRRARSEAGIEPVFGRVDTCAAEFAAHTPYLYSSYESESESAPSDRQKVIIIGGGPNRIGQGIEFDYCCVHAALSLTEMGIETVMINCNPETVSTDYDTSDRLYFEPLTDEDVLAVCREEMTKGQLLGVLVQYGGQTPLRLARRLAAEGVPIVGTPADAIDRAEDRGRFDALLSKLQLRRPDGDVASNIDAARAVANRIGYPVLVRPSYVLGGRAMMICHDEKDLESYVHLAMIAALEAGAQTILIDKFLKDAIEVDVDAVCDGHRVVIGGVMQHIEEAGIHSGDSASVLPPHSLSADVVANIEEQTRQLGLELGVIGLMNVQFAVKGTQIYVIEVNPRASRTVPFVAKATGRPFAKIGAQVMAGKTLDELGVDDEATPMHVAVKLPVFPFAKFPGVDTQLGPEMRSTGEVMGIAPTFARAFSRGLKAAGVDLPASGRAFITVKDDDKPTACAIARRLRALGFQIVATSGTAAALERARVPVETINKVTDGSPHIVDAIKEGTVALLINTTVGAKALRDSYSIRRHVLMANIPYFTNMATALAVTDALELEHASIAEGTNLKPIVKSLQEWHARMLPTAR